MSNPGDIKETEEDDIIDDTYKRISQKSLANIFNNIDESTLKNAKEVGILTQERFKDYRRYLYDILNNDPVDKKHNWYGIGDIDKKLFLTSKIQNEEEKVKFLLNKNDSLFMTSALQHISVDPQYNNQIFIDLGMRSYQKVAITWLLKKHPDLWKDTIGYNRLSQAQKPFKKVVGYICDLIGLTEFIHFKEMTFNYMLFKTVQQGVVKLDDNMKFESFLAFIGSLEIIINSNYQLKCMFGFGDKVVENILFYVFDDMSKKYQEMNTTSLEVHYDYENKFKSIKNRYFNKIQNIIVKPIKTNNVITAYEGRLIMTNNKEYKYIQSITSSINKKQARIIVSEQIYKDLIKEQCAFTDYKMTINSAEAFKQIKQKVNIVEHINNIKNAIWNIFKTRCFVDHIKYDDLFPTKFDMFIVRTFTHPSFWENTHDFSLSSFSYELYETIGDKYLNKAICQCIVEKFPEILNDPYGSYKLDETAKIWFGADKISQLCNMLNISKYVLCGSICKSTPKFLTDIFESFINLVYTLGNNINPCLGYTCVYRLISSLLSEQKTLTIDPEINIPDNIKLKELVEGIGGVYKLSKDNTKIATVTFYYAKPTSLITNQPINNFDIYDIKQGLEYIKTHFGKTWSYKSSKNIVDNKKEI